MVETIGNVHFDFQFLPLVSLIFVSKETNLIDHFYRYILRIVLLFIELSSSYQLLERVFFLDNKKLSLRIIACVDCPDFYRFIVPFLEIL